METKSSLIKTTLTLIFSFLCLYPMASYAEQKRVCVQVEIKEEIKDKDKAENYKKEKSPQSVALTNQPAQTQTQFQTQTQTQPQTQVQDDEAIKENQSAGTDSATPGTMTTVTTTPGTMTTVTTTPAASVTPAASATPPASVMPAASANPTTNLIPVVDSRPLLLPLNQNPIKYLKRLIEYHLMHEKGFQVVTTDCAETVALELYPLAEGWTVFARYSGTGREERVDQVYPDELSQYAQRVVVALLKGVPISDTIDRDNVLRADSRHAERRVRGTTHGVIGVGTQFRGGRLNSRSASSTSGVDDKIRLFTPMSLLTGIRSKFENWGVEATAQLGLNTSRTSSNKNPQGGHIDFGGDLGLNLHFLHYTNPRGITSFYFGGGNTFELLWFSAIRPQDERYPDKDRDTLYSGGLDVDLLCGYEFMRASNVQFFVQGELNIPVYIAQYENNSGEINSYFPGAAVKLGMVF